MGPQHSRQDPFRHRPAVEKMGVEPTRSRLQSVSAPRCLPRAKNNFSGPGRDRTDYLTHAMRALSQMSYKPLKRDSRRRRLLLLSRAYSNRQPSVVQEGIEPSHPACRAGTLPLSYRTALQWTDRESNPDLCLAKAASSRLTISPLRGGLATSSPAFHRTRVVPWDCADSWDRTKMSPSSAECMNHHC